MSMGGSVCMQRTFAAEEPAPLALSSARYPWSSLNNSLSALPRPTELPLRRGNADLPEKEHCRPTAQRAPRFNGLG